MSRKFGERGNVELACEVLKALRAKPMHRQELAATIGAHWETVDRWVKEMTAQGLLVQRKAPRSVHGGHPPTLYAVSPEWGGSRS